MLSVSLRAEEDCKLPEFTGSLLRGSFGHALKRVFCEQNLDICRNCHKIRACVYFQIFESQDNSYKNLGYHYKPHPYIITPSQKNLFACGEELEFQITFFGHFIKHIDFFVAAFKGMGSTGLGKNRKHFSLSKIFDNLTNKPVYLDNEVYAKNISNISVQDYSKKHLQKSNLQLHNQPKDLLLTFLTPGRFAENGKVLKSINSKLLMDSIIRRYSTMHTFYGEMDRDDLKTEKRFAIEPNQTCYKKWNRYSNRQERKVQQSGILGSFYIRDVNTKVIALLHSMEILHVGKNTSFGLGKIKIETG